MGHPAVCDGLGEERETAGSLAAFGVTTRSAKAKARSRFRSGMTERKARATLHVEFEEQNISVFDDVLFAFGLEEAGFFDGLFAA